MTDNNLSRLIPSSALPDDGEHNDDKPDFLAASKDNAIIQRSPCRSLVLSSLRTIALHPSAYHRNLHPSASTQHLLQTATSFMHSSGSSLLRSHYLMSGAAGSQLQFPVTFQQLQNNTDLSLVPSSTSSGHLPTHRPHFSSFQMAHEFVDCLRDVDVVSDAENIKELLKMPFNPKAEVSLLVHRIDRALLIDPFYAALHEQQRKDYSWLHHFQNAVFQKIMKTDPRTALAKRPIDVQWQLMARVVHHTLQQQQCTAAAASLPAQGGVPAAVGQREDGVEGVSAGGAATRSETPPQDLKWDKAPRKSRRGVDAEEEVEAVEEDGGGAAATAEEQTTAVIPVHLAAAVLEQQVFSPALDEVMPEPAVEDQIPDEFTEGHARNIIWNFENLRMLIGTDLPIFGGDTHPCVSLRLADMAKPINVLTGLDYWLDNLMCNVPEVAMCFHLSGIVQKYERIKTEELPELRDSKFSPALVKDIAQNILAFLKDRTNHEGHTYWLFKREDDDVVKLYDLSSLGLDDNDGGECGTAGLNPFTVPAGLLFYRVAKSLLSETRPRRATVTQLLHNAVRLLDGSRYPQIVSSAHYHIADILVLECDAELVGGCSDSSSGEEYDDEAATLPGQMHFSVAGRGGRGGHSTASQSASASSGSKNKKSNKKTKRNKRGPFTGEAGAGAGGAGAAGAGAACAGAAGAGVGDGGVEGPSLGLHKAGCCQTTAAADRCTRHSGNSMQQGSTPSAEQPQQPTNSINLPELCLPSTRGTFSHNHRTFRPPRLPQALQERCNSALSHIVLGLSSLIKLPKPQQDSGDERMQGDNLHSAEQDQNSAEGEYEEPRMANAYESIPLPYGKINRVADTSKTTAGGSCSSDGVEGGEEREVRAQQDAASSSADVTYYPNSSATNSTCDGSVTNATSGALSPVLPSLAVHGTTAASDSQSCNRAIPSSTSNTPDSSSSTVVAASTPVLSVELSSVRYDVGSLSAKLRVMLLHKAAVVLRRLTEDAYAKKMYASAAESAVLCLRCCYAVCYELGVSATDEAARRVPDYPYLKQSLALTADVLYLRAKHWDDVDTLEGEGGGSHVDSTRLEQLLEEVMPAHYRQHLYLPTSRHQSMELCQCYLLLAAGAKITTDSDDTTRGADEGSAGDTPDNTCDASAHADVDGTATLADCTAAFGISVDDSSGSGTDNLPDVRLTLHPSRDLLLTCPEHLLQSGADLLSRLANIMNEMACSRINEAEQDCSADESLSSSVLARIDSEQNRLQFAVYLFVKIGDLFNSAITYTNLAKYYRLSAYFSESRVEGVSFSSTEHLHYCNAVRCYRTALDFVEQVVTVRRSRLSSQHKQQQSATSTKERKKGKGKHGKGGGTVEGSVSCSNGNAKAAAAEDGGGGTSEEAEAMLNVFKMELANTLLMQGRMMMERPPTQSSKVQSSTGAVLTQCYEALQALPPSFRRLERVEKSVQCCSRLAQLRRSSDPSQSIQWVERECVLLCSTGHHAEALRVVTEHVSALQQCGAPPEGPSMHTVLQCITQLLHNASLVAYVVPPSSSRGGKTSAKTAAVLESKEALLLEYETQLRTCLQRLCRMCTSDSTPSQSMARNAFRCVLRGSAVLEGGLTQHLTTACRGVGTALGIPSW